MDRPSDKEREAYRKAPPLDPGENAPTEDPRIELIARVLFDTHFWAEGDPMWYREEKGFDHVIQREQAAGAFDRNRYMETARTIVAKLDEAS